MSAKNGLPCKKCGGNEWYRGGRCVECGRAYTRRWNAQNPEKHRASKRRWDAQNPEKHRARVRRWEAKNPQNPEKSRASKRRWRQQNLDKMNAYYHHYRTRVNGNGGSYTAYEWKAIVEAQNGRCLRCGKEAVLTVDHVIPVSKGGSNDISNIQGLCKPCNSSKQAKVIDYRTEPLVERWIQQKLFRGVP